jgi:hypothetical protein
LRRAFIIVGAVGLIVVSVLFVPALWLSWRDHKLKGFCALVHVGTTVNELLRLEKLHGIDSSYMVGPELFAQQLKDTDLDLRSFPLDPDFVCWIQHDGKLITLAKIVP